MRRIEVQKQFDEESFNFELPFNKKTTSIANSFSKKPNTQESLSIERTTSHESSTSILEETKNKPITKISGKDLFDYKYVNSILCQENYMTYTIVKNSILNR